jgi:hypothetical protein
MSWMSLPTASGLLVVDHDRIESIEPDERIVDKGDVSKTEEITVLITHSGAVHIILLPTLEVAKKMDAASKAKMQRLRDHYGV